VQSKVWAFGIGIYLELLFGLDDWNGSAIDLQTGRAALWGDKIGLFLISLDSTDLGPEIGNFQPIADAAFEPVTGALVVLGPDGVARRFATDLAEATALTFAPPEQDKGAPAPDALALSFPPDEAVVLVLWARTATTQAVVRRYDRATGEPLGEGLEVGFEDMILPDRSALLISNPNGEELQVRDARTGGTVLHVLFEGGNVQLTPSSDGRDLGVVTRGDAIWTLRTDPPQGGTPPDVPSDLALLRLDDQVAVPLPGGVAAGGLALSQTGGTLLVRKRNGQIYAARPAEIGSRDNDLPCCIVLRPVLPGVVAVLAALTPDGRTALIAGADHLVWRVDLATDRATPLLHLAGPVRAMALSADGARLALAADGAAPVVIRLARGWVARLPLIGTLPHDVPATLGRRYPHGPGLPADAAGDTIVLAAFADLQAAVALRSRTRTSGSGILQSGDLYLVTIPVGASDLRTARQSLAAARALDPASRGASLHTRALLCPVETPRAAENTAVDAGADIVCTDQPRIVIELN